MSATCFLIIFLCGALGGLGRAIASTSKHDLAVPFKGNGIRLGFFGDMILGGIAGIIAVAIVDTLADEWLSLQCLHPITTNATCDTNGISVFQIYLRIFAISLLAGFSGLKLMDRLSDGVIQKLEAQLEKTREEASAATEIAKESEARSLSVEAYRRCDKKEFTEANKLIQKALALSRTPLILSRAAVVLSEEAVNLRSEGLDDSSIRGNWEQGLLYIDEALDAFSKSSVNDDENLLFKLYWNKACNMALLGRNIKQIESSLVKAYKMEAFDLSALTAESDFSSLNFDSGGIEQMDKLKKLVT